LIYYDKTPPQEGEQSRAVQLQTWNDVSGWSPLNVSQSATQTSDVIPVGARVVDAPITTLSLFRVVSVEISGSGIIDPLNYPNPFSPNDGGTSFSYTLANPSDVTIVIYDLFGNLVKTLHYGQTENGGMKGYNYPKWDGRNGAGHSIANGGYIVHIVAKDNQGGTSTAKFKAGVIK
jgi:flagellar hook assembly protein FlgD